MRKVLLGLIIFIFKSVNVFAWNWEDGSLDNWEPSYGNYIPPGYTVNLFHAGFGEDMPSAWGYPNANFFFSGPNGEELSYTTHASEDDFFNDFLLYAYEHQSEFPYCDFNIGPDQVGPDQGWASVQQRLDSARLIRAQNNSQSDNSFGAGFQNFKTLLENSNIDLKDTVFVVATIFLPLFLLWWAVLVVFDLIQWMTGTGRYSREAVAKREYRENRIHAMEMKNEGKRKIYNRFTGQSEWMTEEEAANYFDEIREARSEYRKQNRA